MALYAYEAFSKDGKKVRGTIDAPSLVAVKELLGRQGLYPTSIKPAGQEARLGLLQRLFARGVSPKEKILFTKQLAILLKSGVALLQALELLIDQFEGRMHSILVAIKDDVKGGMSLADAMNKYPRVFEMIYVQLVRAGEASGRLEVILERLTEYLERRAAIRKKISAAMQYPIIQMIIALGVVTILVTFVVPQLQGLFEAQGKELPASTQFLMNLSDLVRNHYFVIIFFVIFLILGFRYWRRTPRGARTYDTIKLKIPVVKFVAKTSAVVQFSYTLGMLIEGGVNLAEALDIVVKIIDNRILADALNKARDKIIKEGKIAQYLKETDVFPPIAIYLIRTGEESGQLDTMLLTVAKNYEEELGDLIDRATGLLGPIMLIVMGVIVGFIVMAIAGPIMSAGEGFGV